MLKRFYPPTIDHLFLSDSETESDNDDSIVNEHSDKKVRGNNKRKSSKKECKRSNHEKINEESSRDKGAFKEEPDSEVTKEAKRYQEKMQKFSIPKLKSYQEEMKKFSIPEQKSAPVSIFSKPSFVTWIKLGESMRQKYEQPLHYLTQILLKQWDESRGNNEVMMKQPIGNVIDPSKAEESVWVIEQFNRQFVSYHYIAKLWISDPNYRYFIDDLQNYSSP